MKLSPRSKSYMIPEYSLTGDLLSFLTCNLQYRYQNRGTLPPSMPIQLWFGEFIHGVMEEAYLEWRDNKDNTTDGDNINNKDNSNNKDSKNFEDDKNTKNSKNFPWDWKKDVRPIEEMIDLRLRARGLYPPLHYFCKFKENEKTSLGLCEDQKHPHKLLYSARAESSINIWGPDLFPLIDDAEVLIKGKRSMPKFDENISRSNYYGINGVIDVISSLKIDENENNSIINYLMKDKDFSKRISSLDCDEYEVIIDYKGMKRPPINSNNWFYHQWQLLTYSWLRSKQNDSKPIIAGIIFYLNELVPSTEDLIAIKQDIEDKVNDVDISDSEKNKILNWDEEEINYIRLSDSFKKDRSIRIINIENGLINMALEEFDKVVSNIESSIISETNGISIKKAWKSQADKRTCDACDFKSFCNNEKSNNLKIP